MSRGTSPLTRAMRHRCRPLGAVGLPVLGLARGDRSTGRLEALNAP